MNDTPTLVKFSAGFADDNEMGEDGLPMYRETVNITLARPPLLRLDREATEQDFMDYPEAYEVFKRQHRAVKPDAAKLDAYPLVYWPVPTPAEIEMCLAREITTVQELAALVRRGADQSKIPPNILELAKRAAKMTDLQKNLGKFEVVINKLTAERDELAAQLKEAHGTISAQNSMIDAMKARVA